MSREIIDSIRAIAGTQYLDNVSLVTCTVQSVDLPTRTCKCTPIGGNAATELTANLMTETDDGLLLIPSEGSTVLVISSQRNVAYIALYSQLSKVICIAENGIQFQSGQDGGLVKVAELTTKLNDLENKLNDLISKFNTHVHLGVTTGAGSSGPTIDQETPITLTQRSEIENASVTHGA